MESTTAVRPRAEVFLMLLVLLALAAAARPALAVGEVGDPAADFTLQNTNDETVEVVFGQGEVWLLAFIGFS